jgi:hypothetical protein
MVSLIPGPENVEKTSGENLPGENGLSGENLPGEKLRSRNKI